jgi:hypothetical protein
VEGQERISCRGVAYLVWAFGSCGYSNARFLEAAVGAYFEEFKHLTSFEIARLVQVGVAARGLLLQGALLCALGWLLGRGKPASWAG